MPSPGRGMMVAKMNSCSCHQVGHPLSREMVEGDHSAMLEES